MNTLNDSDSENKLMFSTISQSADNAASVLKKGDEEQEELNPSQFKHLTQENFTPSPTRTKETPFVLHARKSSIRKNVDIYDNMWNSEAF